MRIALLGYGKMGKAIEKVALERGHEVVFKIDLNNSAEKQLIRKDNVDAVIEFSSPHSAYANLEFCMKNGLKTVCGTTGWLDARREIEQLCIQNKASFFYASNYSIGVNLFFKLNEFLAKLMAPHQQYEIFTSEIHHTEKLDAPSGTAITLAEGILNNNKTKKSWVNNQIASKEELAIWSSREGKVPGTHTIKYISEIDEIEIKHTAYTRMGFALGAVLAAEWLQGKEGVYGMNDLLSL
ncbi:4-hydroxy-tetrahydrodipicolinate reductase [Lacihabitans soyangensis]|uniref:4-hydroxy-tetrahydrodipicolinate reductase n=1 Tax=Lacihabitans soyangensis TaxID=869394 RepID=A0AAE3H2L1_9BACT|nr:4-hydroxy-tetrahydrodipicolinate reductase [Lacihabitans soyangensis]MCP9763924.1 4-hydroxy-tetrahydrodipicolinate reductase [Lacihabitans soyangensis]